MSSAHAPDRRSNRCPKCKHTYTSATHHKRCLNKTPRKRSHGTRSVGGRRTMSEILASAARWDAGLTVADGDFYKREEASHA